MDIPDTAAPPAGLLTGGNAQQVLNQQPRRNTSGNHQPTGGSRPPPRDDPESSAQPREVADSGDLVSSGFEKIMARFDRLEFHLESTDRRVDNLEVPILPDTDPPYFSDEADLENHRDFLEGDGEVSRSFNNGTRGRGGDTRRRHVGFHGAQPRDGRYPLRNSGTVQQRPRPYARQRTSWDRPQGRYPQELDRGFQGYRQPTAWPPPVNRSTYTAGRGERSRDLDMKAPRFDGSNASNWISRVDYYFDHLQMPDEERLHYVVMLFQPPAADWIFKYRANNPYATWPEFLEDVRHRFDPQSFRNSMGPLSKLVQTGSVADYHDAFDRYLNRAHGCSEEALIPIFITGLKDPIQEKVELQQPSSLAEAMALALRLGTSHEERQAQSSRSRWTSRESRYQAAAQPVGSGHNTAGPTAVPSKDTVKPGFRPILVSNAEKAERSRKGLCYHCPEKWIQGHACKQKILCYVGDQGGDETSGSGDDAETPITADLSHLHTLTGGSRARPFNVLGTIDTTTVSILIDTGSTHDFLHTRVAEHLKLHLTPIRPFRVYVGNGASLICSHIARGTKLSIQGVFFDIDLHILDIHGPDIVLGMAWLESLGKVWADFVGKTLEFQQNGVAVAIHGVQPSPRLISLQSLAMLASQPDTHEFYEVIPMDSGLHTASTTANDDFPADIPPVVREVLEKFTPVFEVPTGMPPRREFDHRIHLLPHSKPVNVRPYRYPYFQKNEIERQVREMLDQGIIQQSQSPFSSPVLLLERKTAPSASVLITGR